MYVYNRDFHQVNTRQADKARPAKYTTDLASESLRILAVGICNDILSNLDVNYLSLCLKNVYLSIVYINYFFVLAITSVVIFYEYSCMVKLTQSLFVLCFIHFFYTFLHIITHFALTSINDSNKFE